MNRIHNPWYVVFLLMLLPLVLILPGKAFAEIYRWTDAQGRVHFGDEPPKQQGAQAEIVTLKNPTVYDAPSWVEREVLSPTDEVAGKPKKVVMYSTEWCGVCKKAERYFRQKGIPFRKRDIDKSSSARKQYDRLGGRGVPLILVGKKRLDGFSPASFEQIYQGG